MCVSVCVCACVRVAEGLLFMLDSLGITCHTTVVQYIIIGLFKTKTKKVYKRMTERKGSKVSRCRRELVS